MSKNENDSKKVVTKQANVIELILKESNAYTSMDLIESYISQDQSLANIPVQPLYVSMKTLPLEYKSHALTLMTKAQREVFYDLDLWKKDELDTASFEVWVKAVAACASDQVRFEFARGSEFALFFKGKFNVWTFDVEEPEYPDHDNYFLTEDNLLCFEYDADCDVVDEVKTVIRELYSVLGVEAAYQYLFTVIQDGFLDFSEREYEAKKGRMRDFGFVDYFDALDVLAALPSVSHVDAFIKNKKVITAQIHNVGKTQTLHQNSLIAFENNSDLISSQIEAVQDEKRFQYLHFNFVRLINANLEFQGVLKDSSLAMTRVGKRVNNFLNLGIDYCQSLRTFDKSIFEEFDFVDLHRIGSTLIGIVQKRVKKELASFDLDGADDQFLGSYFETYLDDLFSKEVCLQSDDGKSVAVVTASQYQELNNRAEQLISLLPFIKSLKDTFNVLVHEAHLSASYYLNYDLESIDFESLVLSSFVNHALGKFDKEDTRKMGVTITELREFSKRFILNAESFNGEFEGALERFLKAFSFDSIVKIEEYLMKLLKEHLLGYDFIKLEDSEFKHIGGPIIFNTIS